MPIEGIVVKGSYFKVGPDNEGRPAEEVSRDFVNTYEEIARRSGRIIAEHTVVHVTAPNRFSDGIAPSWQRQDTHFIVDFPDTES